MKILLVEDDDGHAHLVQKNLERAGLSNPLDRVSDGEAALQYIDRYTAEAEANRESMELLLLLDINLPRISGFEVLQRLKSDPLTSAIPIIVLTTTDDPNEIKRAYNFGCNVYLTKPVEYSEFLEAIRRLGLFIQIMQVPKEPKKFTELK